MGWLWIGGLAALAVVALWDRRARRIVAGRRLA